jgi:hypothetical protein
VGAREPLLLFALLAGGVLGARAWLGSPEPPAERRVLRLGASDVAGLRQAFERRARRPPTAEELSALIEARVKEELLRHEAEALGLDREDPVVRRRLAASVEALVLDAVPPPEPTPADLAAWLSARPERYREPEARSFEQVWFAPGREAAAEALLARWAVTPPGEAFREAGEPSALPASLGPSTQEEVARTFGTAFATALFEGEGDAWGGPLRSGHGVHLVRVTGRREARDPPLSEVEARVRADLVASRREAALERLVERLRAGWQVVVER